MAASSMKRSPPSPPIDICSHKNPRLDDHVSVQLTEDAHKNLDSKVIDHIEGLDVAAPKPALLLTSIAFCSDNLLDPLYFHPKECQQLINKTDGLQAMLLHAWHVQSFASIRTLRKSAELLPC
jgi:hypothetical protein